MKTPKSLLGIALFSAVVLFNGCSKKSDPGPSLVGTWLEQTEVKSGCTDPTNNSSKSCVDDGTCVVFTFTSSGTYTGTNPTLSGPIAGTYTVNGTTLTLTTPGSAPQTATFTVTSTTLTLSIISSNPSAPGCTLVVTLIKTS